MNGSFSGESDSLELETLAGLAENIVYRLPGCTDLMVRKTLQEVYRDFCRRSCCLRTVRRISLLPSTRHYGVAAMSDEATIDCVAEIRIGRRVLNQGVDYVVNGIGRSVCVELSESVPIPEMAEPEDEMEVVCVEVPRIGAERTPYGFVDKYGDAIVSGVLYRLMSMTGKAWSDPAQASAERANYEDEVGRTRLNYHLGSASGNGNAGFGFDTSDLI